MTNCSCNSGRFCAIIEEVASGVTLLRLPAQTLVSDQETGS
jgi:hypothetical protein